MLSGEAEKEQKPAFGFISLDRGEIHSYVRSKQSQAFDTLQFCLLRKAVARAEDEHASLTKCNSAANEKARCPPPVPHLLRVARRLGLDICSVFLVSLGRVGTGVGAGSHWDRDWFQYRFSLGSVSHSLARSAWSVKDANFGASQSRNQAVRPGAIS